MRTHTTLSTRRSQQRVVINKRLSIDGAYQELVSVHATLIILVCVSDIYWCVSVTYILVCDMKVCVSVCVCVCVCVCVLVLPL